MLGFVVCLCMLFFVRVFLLFSLFLARKRSNGLLIEDRKREHASNCSNNSGGSNNNGDANGNNLNTNVNNNKVVMAATKGNAISSGQPAKKPKLMDSFEIPYSELQLYPGHCHCLSLHFPLHVPLPL